MLHLLNMFLSLLICIRRKCMLIQSLKQTLQKRKLFYDEVKSRRKSKRMRLQVDSEFQEVKIKDLNN